MLGNAELELGGGIIGGGTGGGGELELLGGAGAGGFQSDTGGRAVAD